MAIVNDEVIAEIAERIGITELDVRNVISYYSLLHTKPHGKYHVQVCTNISCMLRGGNEMLAHCKERLGIGNQRDHARWAVLARRSRMHRRMQLGSSRAGELRLSRQSDAGKDGRRSRRLPAESEQQLNARARLPSRGSQVHLPSLWPGRCRHRQVHRAWWLCIAPQMSSNKGPSGSSPR